MPSLFLNLHWSTNLSQFLMTKYLWKQKIFWHKVRKYSFKIEWPELYSIIIYILYWNWTKIWIFLTSYYFYINYLSTIPYYHCFSLFFNVFFKNLYFTSPFLTSSLSLSSLYLPLSFSPSIPLSLNLSLSLSLPSSPSFSPLTNNR